MFNNAAQTLAEVTQLLTPRTWAQGAEAKDAQGTGVHPDSSFAQSYSLTGAVYRVSKFDGTPESRRRYEAAVKLLLTTFQELHPKEHWLKWHDAPERTFADIAELLTKTQQKIAKD